MKFGLSQLTIDDAFIIAACTAAVIVLAVFGQLLS